ncbi:MAG: 16S rRNA (guanine(966)-N(2))-methyltransferase RsmD [Erysipelotrichaceae bacterium]|nr:16S rRNA (guanine(966)-N(2))-methyltransferase RsmD [Erysipelotrichaceae bacterium]
MRVISGTARNRRLEAPKGLDTRPITDRIKESLFNIWQFRVEDSRFLDLFSGSGSVGIEAMSRGARLTVMVDAGREAVNVIKKNIDSCKLKDVHHEVCKEDVFSAIRRLDGLGYKFDLIYADPPFTQPDLYEPLMQALGSSSLLDENGSLAIRSEKDLELAEEYGNLVKYREKTYGISHINFYQSSKKTT